MPAGRGRIHDDGLAPLAGTWPAPMITRVNGTLTAPGTWPAANSPADRTSSTIGASPRSMRSSSASGEMVLVRMSTAPGLLDPHALLGLCERRACRRRARGPARGHVRRCGIVRCRDRKIVNSQRLWLMRFTVQHPRDRGGRRGSWCTAGRHESRIDADLRGSCDAGERANLRSASGRARALRGCGREPGTGTSRRRAAGRFVPVPGSRSRHAGLQPACTTAGDPRTSASRVLPPEARPSLRRGGRCGLRRV